MLSRHVVDELIQAKRRHAGIMCAAPATWKVTGWTAAGGTCRAFDCGPGRVLVPGVGERVLNDHARNAAAARYNLLQ